MENKKLLIIVPTLYGGGAERVISRLAEALSNDCEVLILTFPTPEQYPVPGRTVVIVCDYIVSKVISRRICGDCTIAYYADVHEHSDFTIITIITIVYSNIRSDMGYR